MQHRTHRRATSTTAAAGSMTEEDVASTRWASETQLGSCAAEAERAATATMRSGHARHNESGSSTPRTDRLCSSHLVQLANLVRGLIKLSPCAFLHGTLLALTISSCSFECSSKFRFNHDLILRCENLGSEVQECESAVHGPIEPHLLIVQCDTQTGGIQHFHKPQQQQGASG
jgi:hypothetical protein